jgi:hypothetical protein
MHHLIVMTQNGGKWDLVDITRIIDTQTSEIYTCLKCNENVTNKGLAVSFKVEIIGLDKSKPKKIESDYLMCLEHFDNSI